MSKQTDFTPLHEWVRENGAAGTMFVPSDAESHWEMLQEDDPTLPGWEDVADIVLGTWEWRKGIQEILTERGFEMFDGMFDDVIAGIKKSPEYPA